MSTAWFEYYPKSEQILSTPLRLQIWELSSETHQYLFHSDAYVYTSGSAFGAGSGPIFLADLNCDGSETTLLDCSSSFPPNYYSHSHDAGIQCYQSSYSGDVNGSYHLNTKSHFLLLWQQPLTHWLPCKLDTWLTKTSTQISIETSQVELTWIWISKPYLTRLAEQVQQTQWPPDQFCSL